MDAWCDPGLEEIDSDRMDIVEFQWNDLNQLEDIFRKVDQIAGVILLISSCNICPSIMPNNDFRQQCKSCALQMVLC